MNGETHLKHLVSAWPFKLLQKVEILKPEALETFEDAEREMRQLSCKFSVSSLPNYAHTPNLLCDWSREAMQHGTDHDDVHTHTAAFEDLLHK